MSSKKRPSYAMLRMIGILMHSQGRNLTTEEVAEKSGLTTEESYATLDRLEKEDVVETKHERHVLTLLGVRFAREYHNLTTAALTAPILVSFHEFAKKKPGHS